MNIRPISPGVAEARAALAAMDPALLRTVVDMLRPHKILGTEREAEFADELRKELTELEVPVGDVHTFVAAVLEDARGYLLSEKQHG